MACTPRCTIRKRRSCRRGSADDTFRGDPSGSVAPVQKTSADDAARGHAIESRFSGPDCSVQRSCWPVGGELGEWGGGGRGRTAEDEVFLGR